MATTIYNKQIEAFYRIVGEGDITVVNAANSSSLTKGVVTNYIPKRWTLDEVYDLFWRAGLSLYRVLKAVDYRKVAKLLPSFFTTEDVSLTSNAGSITGKYDFIYEQALAVITGNPDTVLLCPIIPFEELGNVININTTYRKAPTATSPKFSLLNPFAVKVYPATPSYNKLRISGVLAVQRLIACTSNSDSWNENFSDLLISGAVKLAKTETGELGVAEYFSRELQLNYSLVKQKPTKNNIEEQI